jgi:hypothetical protein
MPICASEMATKKQVKSLNPSDILLKPVTISSLGGNQTISALEAGYRNLLGKALNGNMVAAKRMINECISAGLMEPRQDEYYHPGRLAIPSEWDEADWYAQLGKYGCPPWPGKHDGFDDIGREEYQYWLKYGRYR